ncbi:hypothetical protein G9A89_020540 [Geosiphon pyriformis]|nr:hypothetical protein G9A89_020540 [Geosiphon pyriformis]
MVTKDVNISQHEPLDFTSTKPAQDLKFVSSKIYPKVVSTPSMVITSKLYSLSIFNSQNNPLTKPLSSNSLTHNSTTQNYSQKLTASPPTTSSPTIRLIESYTLSNTSSDQNQTSLTEMNSSSQMSNTVDISQDEPQVDLQLILGLPSWPVVPGLSDWLPQPKPPLSTTSSTHKSTTQNPSQRPTTPPSKTGLTESSTFSNTFSEQTRSSEMNSSSQISNTVTSSAFTSPSTDSNANKPLSNEIVITIITSGLLVLVILVMGFLFCFYFCKIHRLLRIRADDGQIPTIRTSRPRITVSKPFPVTSHKEMSNITVVASSSKWQFFETIKIFFRNSTKWLREVF